MRKSLLTFLFLIFSIGISLGQDQIIDNLNKMPSFINPSFYGFKNASSVGVLNKFNGKTFDNSLNYRYAYGSTFIESYGFSVGLDVYHSNMSNSGYNQTSASLSYIYQLEFVNDWYIYAGITGGFTSSHYNFGELVFQDQIDLFTGQINALTIDPLADNSEVKYFDIGASVLMHNNENFLAGISLKHLNQPKNSVDEENDYHLDMLISAQIGYEFDINPYGQSMLPYHSYLYLFSVISKQASKYRLDFFQEATFGTFSLGISQHFNYLEEANMHEFGINTTMHLDFFDFGLSYRTALGEESKLIIDNALSAFVIFDLDPFRSGRRGDFSRFY